MPVFGQILGLKKIVSEASFSKLDAEAAFNWRVKFGGFWSSLIRPEITYTPAKMAKNP